MLQFHFRLVDVNEVSPWGDTQKTLSWFGLTEGWFWIEINGHELFRYTQQVLDHWKRATGDFRGTLPYTDYYVVRYWEDLLQMLPAVLDPLPDDFAARMADIPAWQAWRDRARMWYEADDSDTLDVYDAAENWWWQRKGDAGHLANPPHFWLWTEHNTVHIRWDNRDRLVSGIPVWEAQVGEETISTTDFINAVRDFDARLIREMGERVSAIRQHWPRSDVLINKDQLEREQIDRATWLDNALTPFTLDTRRTDWEAARVAIARIHQEMP